MHQERAIQHELRCWKLAETCTSKKLLLYCAHFLCVGIRLFTSLSLLIMPSNDPINVLVHAHHVIVEKMCAHAPTKQEIRHSIPSGTNLISTTTSATSGGTTKKRGTQTSLLCLFFDCSFASSPPHGVANPRPTGRLPWVFDVILTFVVHFFFAQQTNEEWTLTHTTRAFHNSTIHSFCGIRH